ncbi:MAG: hypothetical protein HKN85_06115, partial [Gammaproteobacteria bacterium]|nr:hypothetical protein [Gammaproteobacteria bacterium]
MNELQNEIVQPIEPTLDQRVMQGLDALGVSYGDEAIANLVEYMELLKEWNKTQNLTAVDDIDQMLSVHIFD